MSNSRLLSFTDMEAARQRALVRALATVRKKEKNEKGKKGASSSTPKVIRKGVPKRKAERKDDRPLKKGLITPGNKQPKKLSPLKPSHGDGKGLMMAMGPITQGTYRLLTHKGYAIKMVESIIKEMDLDPCTKQETEDFGVSGLFDLSRVCSFPRLFYFVVYSLASGCNSFLSADAHEGAPR